MDVMRAAAAAEAAGQSVVHMEVGQPGTAAPAAARAAAAQAVEADRLGYTLALGLPELRARIARHYAERYSVDVDPARVVITSGSSAGFVLAFTALFDRGDRLALPSPGYPCYRQISTALNIEPVIIETGAADRWMPTRAAIEAMAARGNGLDGLLVASPANPTGTMLTPERLADLIAVCRQQNAWFISDEIYHGLTYGEPEATALAYSDDVIVINSFSKYFSMTGWRVGWMVVPERTVATFEKLTQNMYIAAPTISQVAALAAFEATEELEANRARYAQNREVLMAGLAGVGLDQIVPADGAFYLYVDVGHLTDDSLRFARRMLDETGIAVTPGLDFDAERGGRFIRFSYAGTPEDMTACIDRLRAWDVLRGG
ncbi:MAG: aminotransferase class I/II-fold pyridoxal phosphate-dependent enzyme [Pseudomonadota bacterium]